MAEDKGDTPPRGMLAERMARCRECDHWSYLAAIVGICFGCHWDKQDQADNGDTAPCGHEWTLHVACEGRGCSDCDYGRLSWCWAGCGLAHRKVDSGGSTPCP